MVGASLTARRDDSGGVLWAGRDDKRMFFNGRDGNDVEREIFISFFCEGRIGTSQR